MEKLADQIVEIIKRKVPIDENGQRNISHIATLLAERLCVDEEKIEKVIKNSGAKTIIVKDEWIKNKTFYTISAEDLAHAISQSKEIIKLRGEE